MIPPHQLLRNFTPSALAGGPEITPDLVEELVLNAYELVVEGLPRSRRPLLRHTYTGTQRTATETD